MAHVKFVKGRVRGRVIGWAIELSNGDIAIKEFDSASKKRKKKSTRRRSSAQRSADRRRSAAMKRCWRGR